MRRVEIEARQKLIREKIERLRQVAPYERLIVDVLELLADLVDEHHAVT